MTDSWWERLFVQVRELEDEVSRLRVEHDARTRGLGMLVRELLKRMPDESP